jgi:hypothetical protein
VRYKLAIAVADDQFGASGARRCFRHRRFSAWSPLYGYLFVSRPDVGPLDGRFVRLPESHFVRQESHASCLQFLNRRRLREQAEALCRRPETPLELPDEALELADRAAGGGVLGEEPGERGGGLGRAGLSPARDATPWRADPLRASTTRQRPTADPAQTEVWPSVMVTP